MTTPLDRRRYARTPWKNGGGVTIDIAFEGDLWRFSRTPISVPGPFSDYTGFERLQVMIVGRGLVLETPHGEIDLRLPFHPVRFAGETPIVSRLEGGPVEVINLLGDRRRVKLDLVGLIAGQTQTLGTGLHIAYCPESQAALRLGDEEHQLRADGGLRIEAARDIVAQCRAGRIVIGSVFSVSR